GVGEPYGGGHSRYERASGIDPLLRPRRACIRSRRAGRTFRKGEPQMRVRLL
ncbi:MAG: hypothetical protein AVDCRST_MAG91-3723, partial [uncultured Sphingomonadaceae bacterium]